MTSPPWPGGADLPVVPSAGRASRLARAAVELAVRALPDWRDRLRYRAEFLADLHALPPAGQARYAAGVLSQAFALRAALGSTPSRVEEDAMTLTRTRSRDWRCRYLRRHRWTPRSAEDGTRYEACARCGEDREEYPGGGPSTGLAAS